jgi:hypothetical protein
MDPVTIKFHTDPAILRVKQEEETDESDVDTPSHFLNRNRQTSMLSKYVRYFDLKFVLCPVLQIYTNIALNLC